MVVVGGRRVEQTQDFGFCRNFVVLRIFDDVLIDLRPKVAKILQKVAPNPWGFGFGLMGPSL